MEHGGRELLLSEEGLRGHLARGDEMIDPTGRRRGSAGASRADGGRAAGAAPKQLQSKAQERRRPDGVPRPSTDSPFRGPRLGRRKILSGYYP